ncbi:MAG: hypothetical protein AB2803_11470, partial [Candidatus Thiodiazotropha sp.]
MIKNNSSTGINKRWVTEGNGWLWLIVFIPLFGCEAPLFLEGVAAQQREATHRSDMFQAAAA